MYQSETLTRIEVHSLRRKFSTLSRKDISSGLKPLIHSGRKEGGRSERVDGEKGPPANLKDT